MQVYRWFENIPDSLPEEKFKTILETGKFRIQQIVSLGHRSPDDAWYDQQEAEWIIVLKGEARLIFETEGKPVYLAAGDSLNIPAGKRHRVDWTTPDEPTVWLAIFYQD